MCERTYIDTVFVHPLKMRTVTEFCAQLVKSAYTYFSDLLRYSHAALIGAETFFGTRL